MKYNLSVKSCLSDIGIRVLILLFLLLIVESVLKAQSCLNTSPYLFIKAPTTQESERIASCTWGSEYSWIKDAQPGKTYEFQHEGKGNATFFTLREGSYDGVVIASGYAPVSVIANSKANIYIHATKNPDCDKSTGSCNEIWVKCLDCDSTQNVSPCDEKIKLACNQEVTAILSPNQGVWTNYSDISLNYTGSEQVFEFTALSDGQYEILVYGGKGNADFIFMDSCSNAANMILPDIIDGWTDGDLPESVFVTLNKGETIYIVADLLENAQESIVSIEVNCIQTKWDCEELEANIGDDCEVDGKKGKVDEDCNCVLTNLTIFDVKTHNLKFSPNPVVDILTISSDQSIQIVKGYNTTGQMVFNSSLQQDGTLDLKYLKTGIYIFRVFFVNGESASFKLVKK